MINSIVKVQVPMEKSLRDALAELAADRGFDSVQAYVRFWATNAVKGRSMQFEENEPWPEPDKTVTTQLQARAAQARQDSEAGKLPSFTKAADALDYLNHL